MTRRLAGAATVLAVVLAVFPLAGAELDPHRSPPDKEPPPMPPRRGEPVNDHSLYRYFEIEGGKLVAAGRTGSNLGQQLGRKTCRLQLPPPAQPTITLAERAARAELSVVVLGRFYKCKKCSQIHAAIASGFLLSESGAMATCLHVLKESEALGYVALTRDGQLCPVREVLAADSSNDLVILQLEGRGFQALPLSTSAPVGSAVALLSHPDNHYYMLTTGIVSRYFVRQKKEGAQSIMAITAEFARGSSGAPVLNESGNAVALVDSTESIYFDSTSGQKDNFQMTVHNCTPVTALLRLINAR